MENTEMLDEEQESIISLTDENGEEMRFEYLDLVEYQGKEYLVLEEGLCGRTTGFPALVCQGMDGAP